MEIDNLQGRDRNGEANDTGANGDGDVKDEYVHAAILYDFKELLSRPVGIIISVHHGLHSESIAIQYYYITVGPR